jgi:CNT family concentrative nucleoside transporter
MAIEQLQGLVGIVVICLLAGWQGGVFASGRFGVAARLCLTGLAIQLVLATLLLKIDLFQSVLLVINNLVLAVSQATEAGTSFVFGYLGGGPAPFSVEQPHNSYILAFRALPLVLVFSVLSAVFWHWGVTRWIVAILSRALNKSFGIGGAVGYGSASSIFVGMVESPLLIKGYLREMSESDLFIVMTCGMATVAGTVLALYATFLEGVIDNPVSHLLIASVISAPAAIMVALLIKPRSENVIGQKEIPDASTGLTYRSTMHAVSEGTREGLTLFLNIIASLVVFIALVHLMNSVLGQIELADGGVLTIQRLIGYVLIPLVWAIGIPWHEVAVASELVGIKVVINELVAFLQMGSLDGDALSERSRVILSYALCGFANFGSLGIMIGGMCAMCQERSEVIVRLAPLTVWSGLLSTLLTAAVVSLLV